MDARLWLAAVWLVCLGSGTGIAGRLKRAPGPVARIHFPLQPRTPQTAQDRPVQARGRGPRRRRAARGRWYRARQDRHQQHDPEPPHPGLGVPHHAPQGRAGRCRVTHSSVSGGAGRGGADGVLRPERPDLRTVLQLRHPDRRRRTRRAALLRDGTGPGLLRRRHAAMRDGDRRKGDDRCELTPVQLAATVCYAAPSELSLRLRQGLL